MRADWINDPYPVWNQIRNRLQDDNKELPVVGDFLGIFDGDTLAGAFQVKLWNAHCYEIHGGVSPEYFGQGVRICRVLGKALFTYTPCLKIVVVIPEFNHLMRSCVQQTGMQQEGVIKKAFLKWYRLHDLYVYGICKSQADLKKEYE